MEIAFCGLECTKCPAYISKRDDNQELREKTAKEWSSGGFQIEPDQVNCNGCHSDGELLKFCAECNVRNCAIEKEYDTCADCSEYPCSDKLETLWNNLNITHAKAILDKLRN